MGAFRRAVRVFSCSVRFDDVGDMHSENGKGEAVLNDRSGHDRHHGRRRYTAIGDRALPVRRSQAFSEPRSMRRAWTKPRIDTVMVEFSLADERERYGIGRKPLFSVEDRS